jgi:transcriptional regulator with XRE-family HTH domain
VVRLEGDWAAVRAAVRERRLALGLSVAEMARRAGMSETTIRSIGVRPNRRYILYAVDRVLGWPRGHLIGVLTGEPPPPPAPTTGARLARLERKVDDLTALVRNGPAPGP